jgi:hypothetical protein
VLSGNPLTHSEAHCPAEGLRGHWKLDSRIKYQVASLRLSCKTLTGNSRPNPSPNHARWSYRKQNRKTTKSAGKANRRKPDIVQVPRPSTTSVTNDPKNYSTVGLGSLRFRHWYWVVSRSAPKRSQHHHKALSPPPTIPCAHDSRRCLKTLVLEAAP